MAYLVVGVNFRYNFRFKNVPEPPNGGHFENFEIFEKDSFWYKIWKEHRKSLNKKCFDVHDVTDDVTALRQIVPTIFMFKWNCHPFRDTSRSFQPIVTKLGPYL